MLCKELIGCSNNICPVCLSTDHDDTQVAEVKFLRAAVGTDSSCASGQKEVGSAAQVSSVIG